MQRHRTCRNAYTETFMRSKMLILTIFGQVERGRMKEIFLFRISRKSNITPKKKKRNIY